MLMVMRTSSISSCTKGALFSGIGLTRIVAFMIASVLVMRSPWTTTMIFPMLWLSTSPARRALAGRVLGSTPAMHTRANSSTQSGCARGSCSASVGARTVSVRNAHGTARLMTSSRNLCLLGSNVYGSRCVPPSSEHPKDPGCSPSIFLVPLWCGRGLLRQKTFARISCQALSGGQSLMVTFTSLLLTTSSSICTSAACLRRRLTLALTHHCLFEGGQSLAELFASWGSGETS